LWVKKMRKISHTRPSQIMKRWVILMMTVLVLMNVVLIILANFLYNRDINREYTSMVELISHLAYYEDHTMIQAYLEHYEHTQHVVVAFKDDENHMIYPSIIEDTSLRFEPVMYQNQVVGYVYIDFQNSFLNWDYLVFIFIFNGVMILIYSFILFYVHQSMQRLMDTWKDELSHLGDSSYSFEMDLIQEAHDDLVKTMAQIKHTQDVYNMHIKRLAHDIKTPLTTSMIYLEGLLNKRWSYDDKIAQEMMNELRAIDQIVPQFITSDVQQIACVQDLSITIRSMIPRYREILMTKAITISTKLESLEVKISHQNLQTILDHLIFNAFYYSKPNQTIWIESIAQTRTLIVKDQGIGMDQETINQLTQKTCRGPQANQYYAKGTGMGYMIMGKLMTEIHANMQIESQIELGTTIIITFPQV